MSMSRFASLFLAAMVTWTAHADEPAFVLQNELCRYVVGHDGTNVYFGTPDGQYNVCEPGQSFMQVCIGGQTYPASAVRSRAVVVSCRVRRDGRNGPRAGRGETRLPFAHGGRGAGARFRRSNGCDSSTCAWRSRRAWGRWSTPPGTRSSPHVRWPATVRPSRSAEITPRGICAPSAILSSALSGAGGHHRPAHGRAGTGP